MAAESQYEDRHDAGRVLAGLLGKYKDQADVIVLGLPRGGVPVAYEVAQALGAPLEAFLVRKLGVPGHEELAMGAIATGGVMQLNRDVIDELKIPDEVLRAVSLRELQELARRESLYSGSKPPLEVGGKTAILVDDGLATGSTMRAAISALKKQGPARIVVAVPVAARETCAQLSAEVDEVICPHTPEQFYSVGLWYRDFKPTTDDMVRGLLDKANSPAL